MSEIKTPYKAIVIGSSGSIGEAFVNALEKDGMCTSVMGLHRSSSIPIDFQNPESIHLAAQELTPQAPFQLLIIATGVLHGPQWTVEKKLADLNSQQLQDIYQINTIGPALVIKEFTNLLDKNGASMVILSAKVGSIEDNRLGGWYSYRSSKAALNMLIKTAAIELKRTHPKVCLIAMHPGTVNSDLSRPFGGQSLGQSPEDAVRMMMDVINGLTLEKTGTFLSYKNESIPW